MYGDDFQVNNPLGSHKEKNKIHALYCHITAVPLEYSSLLENIFFLHLFKSEYKKTVNLTKLLYPIVPLLIDLQTNGIQINVKGRRHTIYFEIFNITADNAELHNLLGFNESFNSNYPRQKCYMTKRDCNNITKENVNLWRSAEKHRVDINNKLNGVKAHSIFTKINDFDIFKHVSFDPMQDLYEGICRYEI